MFSSCAACLCCQERLLDDLKVEEGEEGEVDENGVTLSNKKVRPLKCLSLQMLLLLLFCVMMDHGSSTSIHSKDKLPG